MGEAFGLRHLPVPEFSLSRRLESCAPCHIGWPYGAMNTYHLTSCSIGACGLIDTCDRLRQGSTCPWSHHAPALGVALNTRCLATFGLSPALISAFGPNRHSHHPTNNNTAPKPAELTTDEPDHKTNQPTNLSRTTDAPTNPHNLKHINSTKHKTNQPTRRNYP